MSQQDTYDMKPDAPAEYRGPYRPIATDVPGIRDRGTVSAAGPVMDRLSIVRSVHHQNGDSRPLGPLDADRLLRPDAGPQSRRKSRRSARSSRRCRGPRGRQHARLRDHAQVRSVRLSGSGLPGGGLQSVRGRGRSERRDFRVAEPVAARGTCRWTASQIARELLPRVRHAPPRQSIKRRAGRARHASRRRRWRW